jgi:hypothetical protein
MKKEVIIAIIVGFTLGLIITFGIHTARRSINQRADSAAPETGSNPPSTTPQHALNLTSPAAYQIVDVSPIPVTGMTTPHSLVTALTPEDEFVGVADDQGKFSIDVDLEAGETILRVVSFNELGQSQEQRLNVVYSTAELVQPAINPDPNQNES